MSRPVGLFIMGDEILSGKRQDRHFDQVKAILAARGLALSWVQYLGDDRERCVRALAQSFGSGDIVFSCGGIGSTPDDHTRQAAAQALGVGLALPGFPVMAWPMIEWVLETHYRPLFRSAAEIDCSMVVLRLFEATVTPLMQRLCERYPQFKFYSLPSAGDDGLPKHVELGVKAQALSSFGGEPVAPPLFERAYQEFREGVLALGGQITEDRRVSR